MGVVNRLAVQEELLRSLTGAYLGKKAKGGLAGAANQFEL